MDKSTFTYKINSINPKNSTPIVPGKINVFVGANNCGKTQVLKDILSFIMGSHTENVIINDLDVPYPENWEIMSKSYNMKIVETNNSKHLQHISPAFDRVIYGPSNPNITEVLSSWLNSNKRAFREATGAGLVSFLNTDNRLKLANSQQTEENLDTRGARNVLEALYLSGSDAFQTVRLYIKKIFGIDIFLNIYNLGTIEFKIGNDFSTITLVPQEANKQLSKYPQLDVQGDGIRSVLGILCAIISVKRPIILLDEPEAFLHPPQALQLGEIISNIIDDNQQIFIATHSADFLRGLLSSTKNSVIIHLNRNDDNTSINVLDSETLNHIITDPLLSSSRVLEGMFYKGVVATEGDADTAFYHRLFQKIGASDEIHFVNAHNKQTLKKLIMPYQKLGIKFAMIADADVIRELQEFKDIIEISSDNDLKDKILEKRKVIYEYFQSKDKKEILQDLLDKIKELYDNTVFSENDSPDTIESIIFDIRKSLKKLRNESDELNELKEKGIDSIPDELQAEFDSLVNNCNSIGLFIVPVGELESWLIDYGVERTSNKSKWITQALDKLYDIELDEDKKIWGFVNNLKTYLVNDI